jgi:hypothetical protein
VEADLIEVNDVLMCSRLSPYLLCVVGVVLASHLGCSSSNATVDADTRADGRMTSDGTTQDVPADAETSTDGTMGDTDDIRGDGSSNANGSACTAASECKSGNCADGVCCDMPCGGLSCRACNIPGSVGSCVFVPSGSDPHGTCEPSNPETCMRDGQCDGQGGCRFYVMGTNCSVTGGKCDGVGHCN